MIPFFRKHKRFAGFLAIYIVMISFGASIHISTCKIEGLTRIDIYHVNTAEKCLNCCSDDSSQLGFKKSSCCQESYLSSFFKARAMERMQATELKAKHTPSIALLSSFSSLPVQIRLFVSAVPPLITTQVFTSISLLQQKSVLNI